MLIRSIYAFDMLIYTRKTEKPNIYIDIKQLTTFWYGKHNTYIIILYCIT